MRCCLNPGPETFSTDINIYRHLQAFRHHFYQPFSGITYRSLPRCGVRWDSWVSLDSCDQYLIHQVHSIVTKISQPNPKCSPPSIKKLDKQAPFITYPSPTSPNTLKKKREKKVSPDTFYIWFVTSDIWHLIPDNWHLTLDTWHLTSDTWHLTLDMWHMLGSEHSLTISAL